MWRGCNNNSNRPIWLEFRASKYFIGLTAAVAAFTVCGLYYRFFVNFLLRFRTVEEGWRDLVSRYADVLSLGWLHIFGRTFSFLLVGAWELLKRHIGRPSSAIFTGGQIRSFRGSW